MRDIVLITVDSLRADHVGWHGYDRNTTPNLDKRAEKSETYTSAFSHACSTRPSFPSILTSSYPLEFGGFERLSPERTTIAEHLKEAGYATAGLHSNLYLSADFGYDRGFDYFFDSKSDPGFLAKLRQEVKTHLDSGGRLYDLLQRIFNKTEKRTGIELGSAYEDAEEITDRALSWVKSANDSPRFLWVHYMDVHHPYVPPEDYQYRFRDEPVDDRNAVQLRRKMLESASDVTNEELDTIIDLYDAEIAYVDEEVSRLMENIEELWGSDVIFAFTADHGEEFLDHGGFSHSATFYEEVLHVPLFINIGNEGDYDELVGLLDLAPTLTDETDLEKPVNFRGESLYIKNPDRSSVIAEWADYDTSERRFALRTDDWKYIRNERGEEELFNLKSDPSENNNIAEVEGEVLTEFRKQVDGHEMAVDETAGKADEVIMDDQVRQRLRDLGYQE